MRGLVWVSVFLLSVGSLFFLRWERLAYPTPALSNTIFAIASREALAADSVRFAVIGDYGWVSQQTQDVATLVGGWNPDFVITTGDNNYPSGEAATLDPNVGQYYHEFIAPYQGSYGAGGTINRFFPSLGNHDWVTEGAAPHLDYFTLPGNERYYDFVRGPVHFFALDSDPHEPDGITITSTQAIWLEEKLGAATAPWKIVYFHHPPYTSSPRGPTPALRWPFEEWGATAILAGHDHFYERILRQETPYFINGLGGRNIHTFSTPIPESQLRYNSDYGTMLVEADTAQITFRFISRTGALVDEYVIQAPMLRTSLYLPLLRR
ncbi:MAG: metallophosphoesterase [Ardenticatenales bacterium]|nr:metallophosphoesterase [Ardenticatenales bacterium]